MTGLGLAIKVRMTKIARIHRLLIYHMAVNLELGNTESWTKYLVKQHLEA